jgi:hypothetical protein
LLGLWTETKGERKHSGTNLVNVPAPTQPFFYSLLYSRKKEKGIMRVISPIKVRLILEDE